MTFWNRIRPEAQEDRREMESRFQQHGRRLQLATATRLGSLRVHNISAGGVSGRTDLALESGERVGLIFEEQQRHDGVVRWVRAELVGIQFPVPLPLLLLQGRSAHRTVPREPRFNIARHATIRHNGSMADAVIRNVSRNGLLIDAIPGLVPGRTVRIGCGSMRTLSASVRWVHHGQAGLRLAQPIDLNEFETATAEASVSRRV